MWTCPMAQLLWEILLGSWQRLGLWSAADSAAHRSFATAIFSLRLPSTPPSIWAFIDQRAVLLEAVGDVDQALQTVWQQQVLGTMQVIWRWRHGVDDDVEPWSEARATSAARSTLLLAIRKAAYGVAHRSAQVVRSITAGLVNSFASMTPVTTRTSLPDRYVLFFDGGSRGNPGPGGAGAVIVRVDTYGCNPSVVWSAAMSMAATTTTNNQAEYAGLLHGLRAATNHKWQPLEVVGDSSMIISQLRDSRPPKHPRLRRAYGHARILEDKLGVIRWHHHVRAFNKMADAAANLAMDSRASLQALHPTDRPQWGVLQDHLLGDITQWQASTNPGPPSSG